MRNYTITPDVGTETFLKAPHAQIDCYTWDTTGYRPQAYAQLLYGADHFLLRFEATEKELRTQERGISATVYKDSAVELFLMPAPHVDGRYVNLEFNSVGAMYIGVGTCREDNILLKDEDLFQFRVRTEIRHIPQGYHWTLQAYIPFSFLARYTGFTTAAAGYEMRGNFYKIAEGASTPYFGSWSPITYKTPDFHRPEFFGSLVCI